MKYLGLIVGFVIVCNFGILELSRAANILLDIAPVISGNRGINGPNDTTPNPFSFQAKYDVARSTYIYSDTITVTGISSPAPISITNGTYSIDGGGFVSHPRLVKRNQKVQIRVMSSGAFSTSTAARVNIGGIQRDFQVTTSGEISVLQNETTYLSSSSGTLYIIGEIRNNSSNYLRLVKIGGSIFNSSGQLLDADYTYSRLFTLPPGEKTCYKLRFTNTEGATHDWIEPPIYSSIGDPSPKLTVYNHSGIYDARYENYEIVGLVRNDTGQSVTYVEPVGTLYNSSGKVIDCDSSPANSSNLSPGQSSAFNINFWYFDDYQDVTSYRLQVDSLF